MEQQNEYRQQLVGEYKQLFEPFLRYLPWLEKMAGSAASSVFQGQNIAENSISFPVYDGTLINFVKELSKTELMDKNYKYIYTRNHIRSHADERRLIAGADLKDWDLLKGILSYYVLGGMTKAALWSQGMEEHIFYLVLKQMKQIIEYWDQPFRM